MIMIENYFRKVVFKSFFKIDLNAVELDTAEDSLSSKYSQGFKESMVYGLLLIPTLLFVDTTVLSSVLIPITMVSGTAWFAVSLVNIKQKFGPFGNELTIDLYRSFVTSLIFLSLMTLIALNPSLFSFISTWGKQIPLLTFLSGVLGTLLVFKMIYDVFSGATKYDMNDSMLTGQSEAAEKYFKRSLSLLNSCGDHLKSSISSDSSGYYVGLAFFEVFNYVLTSKGDNPEILQLITETSKLKAHPPNTKKEIALVCIRLIEQFLILVTNHADSRTNKGYKNIQLELVSIRDNSSEGQDVLNLRLATIFEEMQDMLASQGEMLFKKRIEIEKKFLLKNIPDLSSEQYYDILQGYLPSQKDSELRIRKYGDRFLKTSKKSHVSGYREEIEEYISKEEFERLWPHTEGRRIEKTRYRIPFGDLIIELDIFSGKNKGLEVAEVEFDTEDKANTFVPPKWFGQDVTLDSKYKNVNLAG